MDTSSKVLQLLKRGATIHCPASVFIGETVDLDCISPDIVIHPGCRITGRTTSIGPSCVLGEEGPVTIDSCRLSRDIRLGGGFFSGAVMLAGVRFGSCAHVRPATLIEENVHCGHAVGLKQTILFPFVRLGSLINFCDCLTAGGSSDKSHSEVGSSYVHFNYSPRGDKATASLAGDVPRGVMLDQEPIFLGGQGGLVGPTRIEYGTVIAAGVICRRDILKRGRLVFGQGPQRPGEVDYKPALSADIDRLVRNNLAYIGNLCALTEWYRHVRSLSLARDRYDIACLKGALNVLDIMLRERCKQFNELIKNTVAVTKVRAPRQGNRMQGRMQVIRARLMRWWPKVLPQLESGALTGMDKKNRDTFLSGIQVARSRSTHLDLMSKTSQSLRRVGTTWLQSMVDSTMKLFAD